MWTEAWNWINAQWAEIASTGALGILTAKAFIFDKIGLSKKTEDFTSLKNVVTTSEQATSASLDVIYEKFEALSMKMDRVLEENQALRKINEEFKALTIQTLSIANVPLQGKTRYFEGLQSVVSGNSFSMDSFKELLDVQTLANQVKEEVSNSIIDKVKGV